MRKMRRGCGIDGEFFLAGEKVYAIFAVGLWESDIYEIVSCDFCWVGEAILRGDWEVRDLR